jgi:hypothetical protein
VYPSEVPSAIAGDDANLCLPQLLLLLENPMIAADWMPELAQNTRDLDRLKALGDLWRSLGRPTSGFWQHTYVFCNRITDSYEQKNPPRAETRKGAGVTVPAVWA